MSAFSYCQIEEICAKIVSLISKLDQPRIDLQSIGVFRVASVLSRSEVRSL